MTEIDDEIGLDMNISTSVILPCLVMPLPCTLWRCSLTQNLLFSNVWFCKSNTMKKHLNTYCQHCRIDPDEMKAISDDEPEDPMPDVKDFLGLPWSSGPALTHGPSSGIPLLNCPTTATTAIAPPGPSTLLPLNPHPATSLGPPDLPPLLCPITLM